MVVAGQGGAPMGGEGGGGGVAGAQGGGGGSSECTTGTSPCNGEELQKCDGTGKWIFEKDCSNFGCNESRNACNGCIPLDRTCSFDSLSVCSAEGVPSTTRCVFGCNASGMSCRECPTDNEWRCVDGKVSRCVTGSWSTPLSCPESQVCSAGVGCTCPTGTALMEGICYAVAGHFAPFDYAGPMASGYFGGLRVQVESATTLRGFGLIATAGGPRVRMALYRDNNGTPSSLVSSTPPTTLVKDRNHIPVSPVALSAGDYWLVANYESSATLRQNNTGGPYRYIMLNFAMSLPTNFSGSATSTVNTLNYYVLLD